MCGIELTARRRRAGFRPRSPRAAAALLAVALLVPTGPALAAELDWTLGEWQGTRRDGADGSRAPVRLRVEPILGGAGFVEHLEVTHEGGVYRGFAAVVREVDTGVWVRQYVNPVRGRFVRLEGVIEGDRSTWRRTLWLDELSRVAASADFSA